MKFTHHRGLSYYANQINNDLDSFTRQIDEKISDGAYIELPPTLCGGMTQIDPPSLQLDAGPADTTIDSVVDDLQGIVVLC